MALVLWTVLGCSQAHPPIFAQRDEELAWPPPPAPARVRYVGELSSSADLKAAPGLLEAIGGFFVGAKEPDRMYGPRAVLTTGGGRRVWVADSGGRRLHVFDLQDRSYRKITRVGNAPLLSPADVCPGPGDSVLVCDSEAVAIHLLSEASGELIASMELPEDLRRPVALHYDAERQEVFAVDAAAHDVKVLSLSGRLRRIVGRRGEEPGEFNFPCDIAEHEGTIWIADTGNNRVQGLSPSGSPLAVFGREGDAPGDLALPKGIAFDSEGHAYVVDGRFENVQIFDRSGRLLLFFGEEGIAPGEFWLPSGIFIDADDRIWVCDTYNGRVQVFDYLPEAQGEPSED